MKAIPAVLTGCLLAAYPLLVYFGLREFSTPIMALFLLLLALARLLTVRSNGVQKTIFILTSTFLALVAVSSLLTNDPNALRFYPVIVNTVMLAVFGLSLKSSQSIVERIARIREPELPASGVLWCRKVTMVWCVFFILNGTVSLWTALWASLEWWTLYNGLIAYLLMGLLFSTEWLLRQRHMLRKDGISE